MQKILFLTAALLILNISVSAQVPVTKSEKTIKENGRFFYLHTVKNGQTLYSISKAYEVSVQEITKANHISSNSISAGQVLRIPNASDSDENDDDFKWHRVKTGETVYAISQKYGVSVADIYYHNKKAVYGISKNMVLKIPNSRKFTVDFSDDSFFYHTVESGNTFFSLSQQYGISIEQIKQFNPEAADGLKVGQVLKLPKLNYDETERLPVSKQFYPNNKSLAYDPLYYEEPGITPCNKFTFDQNKTYKIAVMLPLYTDKNLWLMSKYKSDEDRMFYKNSQRFVEMYEGILLALQRLKLDGVSIDVQVFDTQNSTVEVKGIIDEINFSDLDLIIGPVYSENFKMVSYYAKKHKINIISPLSSNSELPVNNTFVFNIMPSDEMRVKRSADFLSRLYDSCLVIVHGGSQEEQKLINLYKQKLVKSFTWNDRVNEVVVKSINYNTGGSTELEKALSPGYQNLVLVPSNNEVFVTKIVEKLAYFTDDYDIKLIGSPEWEFFQNVNLSHLHKEQFHYISPAFINYENWRVQSFIKHYRNTFETEPSIYAFQGYDIMYYFGSALKTYGRHFQFCLSPYDKAPNPKGLVFNFDFARTGRYNGFENNGLFFLKYSQEFKLQEAGY